MKYIPNHEKKSHIRLEMCYNVIWIFVAMNTLANDENVTMEVMAKICNALDCTMDDIVEIIPEEERP